MEKGVESRFKADILIGKDMPVEATIGTLNFWVDQPRSIRPLAFDGVGVPMETALRELAKFIYEQDCIEGVWANGTKFDLGMLEYQYKLHGITIPWCHNDD